MIKSFSFLPFHGKDVREKGNVFEYNDDFINKKDKVETLFYLIN